MPFPSAAVRSLLRGMKLNANGYFEGTLDEYVEYFRSQLGKLTPEQEEKLRRDLKAAFALQSLTKRQMGHS